MNSSAPSLYFPLSFLQLNWLIVFTFWNVQVSKPLSVWTLACSAKICSFWMLLGLSQVSHSPGSSHLRCLLYEHMLESGQMFMWNLKSNQVMLSNTPQQEAPLSLSLCTLGCNKWGLLVDALLPRLKTKLPKVIKGHRSTLLQDQPEQCCGPIRCKVSPMANSSM